MKNRSPCVDRSYHSRCFLFTCSCMVFILISIFFFHLSISLSLLHFIHPSHLSRSLFSRSVLTHCLLINRGTRSQRVNSTSSRWNHSRRPASQQPRIQRCPDTCSHSNLFIHFSLIVVALYFSTFECLLISSIHFHSISATISALHFFI